MISTPPLRQQMKPFQIPAGLFISMFMLIIIAPILGFLAGTGNLLFIVLLVLMVVTALISATPGGLLWISLVGGLLVAGLLELYLPNLQIIRWAFAGAAVLLPISAIVRNMLARSSRITPMPTLFYWAMAFIVIAILTTVLNWYGVGSAIYGWKSYFQVWGLLVGLALLRQTPVLLTQLPKIFLVFGLLQIPFALHQFVYLVPQRVGLQHGIVPVDIVVGTFGASLMGGGANAALAVFQVFLSGVVLALWRTGAISRFWAFVLVSLLLVPIFINESKISVLYVILVFAIVFRAEIFERPLRFLAMSGLVSAVALGLVFSYASLHESSKYKKPQDLIEHVVEQNTQEGVGYGTYSLNRMTTLRFWAEERKRYNVVNFLIGHGLGQSRDERSLLEFSQTMAVSRYFGMGIGLTTLSSLLWDVGVIGLVVMLGMFVSAFRLAGKLSRHSATSPWDRGWFQGIQAGIAVLTLSLAHKNFLVFHMEFQTFVLFLMGYLIHAARSLDVIEAKPGRSVS